MPDAAIAARGVYKPQRPQTSPLFRLVSDHLPRLQTVYDDRFARIRCDTCTHDYLLVFSCKCRYSCPNCHAERHFGALPRSRKTCLRCALPR